MNKGFYLSDDRQVTMELSKGYSEIRLGGGWRALIDIEMTQKCQQIPWVLKVSHKGNQVSLGIVGPSVSLSRLILGLKSIKLDKRRAQRISTDTELKILDYRKSNLKIVGGK